MADNYSVTGQRQTTDLGPDGRFRDVMEVSFVTKDDVHAQVRVPISQYTPDEVHRRIDEYVAAIDSVHHL